MFLLDMASPLPLFFGGASALAVVGIVIAIIVLLVMLVVKR